MQLNSNAIQATTNIPDCMTIQELQQAILQDDLLQDLQEHIIRGWPEHKDQIPQDMRMYWTFYVDMTVIDGVMLKERHVVIPGALQREALEQLCVYHTEIEKTKLLAC